MENLKLLDLFCGAGGLSKGFEMADFEIVAGIDIVDSFLETFGKSHKGAVPIKENLKNDKISDVLLKNGLSSKQIDVVIGGPPCQGFSTVGNRMIEDPRNKLVLEFAKVVKEIKPKVFLMENVSGLVSMKNGLGELVVDELLKVFECEIGYDTKSEVLNAANFGVPQVRKRLFLCGVKKELGLNFSWPDGGDYLNEKFVTIDNHRTMEDALSDLPRLSRGESKVEYSSAPKNKYQEFLRGDQRSLLNHAAPKHSDIVTERIMKIHQGGNHSNLPKNLKLTSGYPNIYGRGIWKDPSSTLTANFGCVSAPGRFIHPLDNRALTVREGARLQSFPDNVKFFGSMSEQYKQVGNAVPPLLAKAIAIKIKKCMTALS